MNKTEVVKIMQEELNGLELEVNNEKIKFSQDKVSAILDAFENTCAKVGEELEVGESCFVSCVKVSKKEVAAKSGTSILRGEEVEWETPAKIKVVLGTKKSFEKEHEQEI